MRNRHRFTVLAAALAVVLSAALPAVVRADVIADTSIAQTSLSATVPTLDACLQLGRSRALIHEVRLVVVTLCSDHTTGLPIARQYCNVKDQCTVNRYDGQ